MIVRPRYFFLFVFSGVRTDALLDLACGGRRTACAGPVVKTAVKMAADQTTVADS